MVTCRHLRRSCAGSSRPGSLGRSIARRGIIDPMTVSRRDVRCRVPARPSPGLHATPLVHRARSPEDVQTDGRRTGNHWATTTRAAGRRPVSRLSAGELAHIVRLHPSTITGILQRLVARGLLERERDPGDSRRARLRLKPARVVHTRTSPGTVEKVVTQALNRIGASNVRAARRVLAEIAQRLNESEVAAGYDGCVAVTRLIQQAVVCDDAFDAPGVGAAHHRQDAAALRETLEHDIDRMIGMRVHERVSRRPRTTASLALSRSPPVVRVARA